MRCGWQREMSVVAPCDEQTIRHRERSFLLVAFAAFAGARHPAVARVDAHIHGAP